MRPPSALAASALATALLTVGCSGDRSSEPSNGDRTAVGDAGNGRSAASGSSGSRDGEPPEPADVGDASPDSDPGATGAGGAAHESAGSGASESGSPDAGGVDAAPPPVAVITPTPPDAELATASGCSGVFSPDQLLALSFEMDAGDFSRVLADTTYSIVVPARMQCQDEPPLTVGVRRKRSGGQYKVGFKIDINEIVAGQRWYGLKKLSLENGVSEGDSEDGADVETYVAEFLAWRLMTLSGAISSRAALVDVRVNGEPLGVYVNVEQVDKRFLQARLGDDTGWLYKKSGGINDGLKTNELGAGDNPYDDYFCFWDSGNGCALPSSSELAAELPGRLDIAQFLRFGAVNALIANTDGPLFKDNNYYYYDYAAGPRVYLPWDLDTSMRSQPSLFSGGGGGTSDFDAALFTSWRDDYEAVLQDLLANRLTAAVIEAELDRVLPVAGAAFAADPYVSGTASDAVTALKAYWMQRLAFAQSELP